jgi:hypothetical protein
MVRQLLKETRMSSIQGAPITYAESIRFQPPDPPTYPVPASIASIASLVVMAGVSTAILLRLRPLHLDPTAWVWLPFAFTIFGSTLGLLFESALLLRGIPFQQMRTPGLEPRRTRLPLPRLAATRHTGLHAPVRERT